MSELIKVGRAEKLERIVGYIHPENQAMQKICQKLGFTKEYLREDQLFKVTLDLK